MPETSTPTLTPDGTTKFPAFQNNNPGNVEVDALKAYILSQAGLANGLATLDAEGKLDSSQIPVNLDDVLVYPSYASLPATGETGKLYITSDVNGTYYWNGTSYQILNQSFVRYRGSVSSLPSDPQPGDWFIAASSFSSYTSGHIYLYNGSTWDDVTAVFGQFVLKTDIAQSLGQQTDKVPSNKAVDDAISALSAGVVVKGECTYAELLAIQSPEVGWEYWVTDKNAFYLYSQSDGWIEVRDNGITQSITDGDTTHAPSADAVYDALTAEATARTNADSNLQQQINQHDSRLSNLEQKAGDYVPVQYRGTNAVPTGKASYGLVEKIVGKSRAWNELFGVISTPTMSMDSNYIVSMDNISGEVWASQFSANFVDSYGLLQNQNHVYLVFYQYVSGTIGSETMFFGNGNDASKIFDMDGGSHSVLLTGGSWYPYIKTLAMTDYTNLKFRFVIRDLSVIFPEYTNAELMTLGADATIAMFPDLTKSDAYNAGSLVSTTVEGVEAVGVNIWDEEWENNALNRGDGTKFPNQNSICSKNPVKVFPNTSYYFKIASNSRDQNLLLCEYSANGTYLGYLIVTINNPTYTTRIDTAYILFYWDTSDIVGEYDHTFQICLNSLPDAIKTVYHPYKPSELTFSEPVTLRSAGSVADEYTPESGEVKRYSKQVIDLSTLTWNSLDSSYTHYFLSAVITGIKGSTNNAICPRYTIANVAYSNMPDKSIRIESNGQITVRDDSYSISDITSFKNSLSGLGFVCELASMETESLTPVLDNTIYTEGGGTINTIQTQTPVIDNSLDVGYLAV